MGTDWNAGDEKTSKVVLSEQALPWRTVMDGEGTDGNTHFSSWSWRC